MAGTHQDGAPEGGGNGSPNGRHRPRTRPGDPEAEEAAQDALGEGLAGDAAESFDQLLAAVGPQGEGLGAEDEWAGELAGEDEAPAGGQEGEGEGEDDGQAETDLAADFTDGDLLVLEDDGEPLQALDGGAAAPSAIVDPGPPIGELEAPPSLEDQIRNQPRRSRTKLTLALLRKLEDAAMLTRSFAAMAASAGITKPTIYNWFEQFPELRLRLEQKRQQTLDALVRLELRDAAKGDVSARRFLLQHRDAEFRRDQERNGWRGPGRSGSGGGSGGGGGGEDPDSGSTEAPDFAYI